MAIKKPILNGTDFANVLIGGVADEFIFGNGGNDVLYGGLGNDAIYGGIGNDFIDGGLGVNILDGGAGIDILSYATLAVSPNQQDGVSVYLFKGLGGITGRAPDVIKNFENVVGSKFSDLIMGDVGDNKIYGGAERDFLFGKGGNDTLYGGTSGDWLFGGDGNDILHAGVGGGNEILGDLGTDIADYSELKTNITIALIADPNNQGSERVTGQGSIIGDHYYSIEKIVGTAFDDSISNVGADVDSGAGKDHIVYRGIDPFDPLTPLAIRHGISADGYKVNAGSGDDIIEASGAGQHIIAGTGLDWIVLGTFELGPSATIQTVQLQYAKGFDNIWYYGAEDRAEVSMSEFGITNLANVDFIYTPDSSVIGPTPATANPTFMYIADIGMLFYDRDGTGHGFAAVAIAAVGSGFAADPALLSVDPLLNFKNHFDFIA